MIRFTKLNNKLIIKRIVAVVRLYFEIQGIANRHICLSTAYNVSESPTRRQVL